MVDSVLSPIYALSANLCFSISTIFFAHYSIRVSAAWMNTLKTWVSLFFFIFLAFFSHSSLAISWQPASLLLLSGFIGLGLGDLFLLTAFVKLGPARTLLLFSFQPIIFLFIDSLVFGEHLETNNIIAVFIFILCLVLFSSEHYKKTKSWNILGFLIALSGVLLDGTGVFCTKKAFLVAGELSSTHANIIRNLGALFFYFLYSMFKPIDLFSKFRSLPPIDKKKVLLFSFVGTFLSLFFYLEAIKLGKLSLVTAISITSPIFATFFEALIDKKKPSKTLILCLLLFVSSYFINLI